MVATHWKSCTHCQVKKKGELKQEQEAMWESCVTMASNKINTDSLSSEVRNLHIIPSLLESESMESKENPKKSNKKLTGEQKRKAAITKEKGCRY